MKPISRMKKVCVSMTIDGELKSWSFKAREASVAKEMLDELKNCLKDEYKKDFLYFLLPLK